MSLKPEKAYEALKIIKEETQTPEEKALGQNYFKLRCILVKESCNDLFKHA